jgi:hypothetical protein
LPFSAADCPVPYARLPFDVLSKLPLIFAV